MGASNQLLQGYNFHHYALHLYSEVERNVFKGIYQNKRVQISANFGVYAKQAINYYLYAARATNNKILISHAMKDIYVLENMIEEVTRRVNVHNAANSALSSVDANLPINSPKIPFAPEQKYDSKSIKQIEYPTNQLEKQSNEYKKLLKLGSPESLLKAYSFIHEAKYQFGLINLELKKSLPNFVKREWNFDSYYDLAERAKNYFLSINVTDETIKYAVLEIVYSLDDMITNLENERQTHNRINDHFGQNTDLHFIHDSDIDIPKTPHQNYISRVGFTKPTPQQDFKEREVNELILFETAIDPQTTSEYRFLQLNKASYTVINRYYDLINSRNFMKDIINNIKKYPHQISFDGIIEIVDTCKYNLLSAGATESKLIRDEILKIVLEADGSIAYFNSLIKNHNEIYQDQSITNFEVENKYVLSGQKMSYPKYEKVKADYTSNLKSSNASAKTLEGLKYVFDVLNALFDLELYLSKAKPSIKFTMEDYIDYSSDAENFIIFYSNAERKEIRIIVDILVNLLRGNQYNTVIYLNKYNSKVYSSQTSQLKMQNKPFIPKVNLNDSDSKVYLLINNNIAELLNKLEQVANTNQLVHGLNLISSSVKVTDYIIKRAKSNLIDSKINLKLIYDHVESSKSYVLSIFKYRGVDSILSSLVSEIDKKITFVKTLEQTFNNNCSYCKDYELVEIPHIYTSPPLSKEKLSLIVPKIITEAEIKKCEYQLKSNGADQNILNRFSYIAISFNLINNVINEMNTFSGNNVNFTKTTNYIDDSLAYFINTQINNEKLRNVVQQIYFFLKDENNMLKKLESSINNSSVTNEMYATVVNNAKPPIYNPRTMNNLDSKKNDLLNVYAGSAIIKAFDYANYCFSELDEINKKVKELMIRGVAFSIDQVKIYCERAIQYFLFSSKNSKKEIEAEVHQIVEMVEEKMIDFKDNVAKHNSFVEPEPFIDLHTSKPEIPDLGFFKNLNKPK